MTLSRFHSALFGLSALEYHTIRGSIPRSFRASLLLLTICAAPHLRAQAAGAPPDPAPVVPDWALPGSATHKQVPPPADFHRPSRNFDTPIGVFEGQSDIGGEIPDFHRPSRNFDTPIGVFEGQSDIGGALVPGSASYDAGTKQYTINSAGYNIWYQRDELRYLWKKISGDVSLAADVAFPDPKGYGDRKAVLVIRQNLDDDSKEAMAGQHSAGMIHLAQRPERGADIKDMPALCW